MRWQHSRCLEILRRLLMCIVLLAVFTLPGLQQTGQVSAASGYMTWIDPYCTGTEQHGADPGFHWWEQPPLDFGYGRATLFHNGTEVARDPIDLQRSAHGWDVTIGFYVYSYSGSGRYTTNLEVGGSFVDPFSHQEYIDC